MGEMYTAGNYFSYHYILYRFYVILRKDARVSKLGNAIQFHLQIHLTTVDKYSVIECRCVEFSSLAKFEKFFLHTAENKV